MKGDLVIMKIFIFFLLAIGFSCQKELTFDPARATGSLKDPSGVCFPQAVYGTFYNGINPGTDTAYIEIKVNVITTGSYSILTDLQNGFRFADSGSFKNTGINVIKLKSTGTPFAHIPTNFTIRFDTSACPLTVNVADSAILNQNTVLPVYNWEFTDTKRGLTYRGLFEHNYILSLGTFHILVLSTKNALAAGDTSFIINIDLPNGTIATGTYSTDDPPNGIVFKTFSDACVNCAGGGLLPISTGATIIIIITAYDPVTKIVKGTFSGTTIDYFNQVATIAAGQFSAMVE